MPRVGFQQLIIVTCKAAEVQWRTLRNAARSDLMPDGSNFYGLAAIVFGQYLWSELIEFALGDISFE
jgi:hypothetical protein